MDAITSSKDLQASPELFRLLADNLPQLAWIANAEGWIFWYNQRWLDYTGKTLADMEGWGWRSVHHPDEVENVTAHFQDALATGRSFEAVFPLRRHDGVYRQFLTRAEPIRCPAGNITHWFGTNTDVTDQLATEQELLASEERVSLALAAGAIIGTWDWDLTCDRFTVDQQFADNFGLDPALGRTGLSLEQVIATVHPDDRQGLTAAIEAAIARGGPYAHQYRVRRLDGRYYWIEANGRVDYADGKPVRFPGVLLDLEEKRRTEAERDRAELLLKDSEALFRTTAEVLPGNLFVAGTDGRNIYVNQHYKEYTGLDRELLGDDWTGIVHPDDLPALLESAASANQSGEAFTAQYRMRRRDGEWRYQSMRSTPTRDESGEIVRWVGVALDVHDQREAEERYRSVFNSAAVGIGRVSPDGPFLEINDRYCEILGRSREEIIAGGWAEITHPEDLAGDLALVNSALSGEVDHYTLEKRYLAKDGSDIWVNLTVSAEREADGSVRTFIAVVEDIGERKAAEAALKSSEERYRALFESMDQGFCTIQVTFEGDQPADYRFTEFNPAFTRHTGLEQDILNRSVSDAVPGLERSWFERYGEIARTGVSQRFIDHAAPLGRWFEVYAFRIGDPAQRSVAILFSDVTERIRQEEALRNSERELRLRLNAIPQMVWSTRPNGFHDFYNDRWYEFTGTPLGSTDGHGWNGMFHPDDQPRAWERWQHSLETGTPYEIEYRLRYHDGSFRWVLGRALPIRNEAGEVVRWMGTCTDIDSRIEAEHRLQESEARVRAILKSVPVGLVFADATGKLTGSNELIADFLAHDMVESRSVADYETDYVAFHADGRQVESHEYPLARALAGEERPALECRVKRGDGSFKWLRYVASPIRGPDNSITGGVVASIDVDRERRLTLSLEKEVEKVVAEREAAQDALRQSQKLEAMGQLTGGVAHDFNNLLTPIIGSLDLLQRKQVLDDRTGKLVEGALASAERARTLVQRLLAFARRQPLKPQPVDLGRIVTEMSELIASTSGPRVRVDVSVPDDLPPALADSNQLEMALLNLAVNGRDAMPDGGTLGISVRREENSSARHLGLKPAPHLVLAVADTGVGMDEDTRRRAIEPFFSTKGIGKGTGLGLSMVHGLAAQLGGALDIRSAPGMGTVIELFLPIATDEVRDAVQGGSEHERKGAGIALLVDDEELVRASTAGMLADLGYSVVEAASGEEALRQVRDGLAPDLLVTDQLMPGLSGTDLAVLLREERSNLPVLVVSGYADLHSLSSAFPHLSKPFRQAELAAALERLVKVSAKR